MTCDADRVFPRRKTLSLDEVEEEFTMVHKEIEKDWIQTLSDCFERKLRLFEDTKLTQYVCLGLGSLSNYYPYDPWPKNPLHLLIFLTILVELLRKKHNIQDIYFQDPRFTAVDISFLRSQEYHVLDDPRAFEIIDSSTLVFAPGLHRNLYAQAFAKYRPALLIGNNLEAILRFMDASGVTITQKLADFIKETFVKPIPFLKGELEKGKFAFSYMEIRWLANSQGLSEIQGLQSCQ